MFHHLFEKANSFYEKSFGSYGRFLAKYHLIVIVGAFFLNLFLSAGMIRFHMITDADTLFMPEDSQARKDELLVKHIFNDSTKMTSDFFLHQILDLGTWAEINFQTCNNNDSNILRGPYLRLIKKINSHLLNKTTAETFLNNNHTTRTIKFEDVCARRNDECLIDGADLVSEQFYEIWLKDAMHRKQRFYDENSIFDKSSDSIASEFRLPLYVYLIIQAKNFQRLKKNGHANVFFKDST